MRKQRESMKVKGSLIVVAFLAIQGCLFQEDPFRQMISENLQQCVNPITRFPSYISPDGISTLPDGTLFGAAGGDIFLFNNKGELLWTREVGSTYALLLNNGKFILAESYNKKESWKSSIVKFNSEGNRLWERQTGLVGSNGLAATLDGSFIAVGATDQEKNGHIMLFDQDGNKLWDHQLNGRVESVAVSKSGYVMAKPRDAYVYVYDCTGELIFTYFTGGYYEARDLSMAPDESFFLFASGKNCLNCYTFQGELVWQKELESVCATKIAAGGEYIAVGTCSGKVFLLDKNGNPLWSKEVSDISLDWIAISAKGEYVALCRVRGLLKVAAAVEVYNREGKLLWLYEEEDLFKAVAMSDDGHYLAAGGGNEGFLIFDNFQAIEEYASSECAQKGASLE